MRDWGDTGGIGGIGIGGAGMRRLLMAETLGLAMARRAAEILDRHRDVLMSAAPGETAADANLDGEEFATDDAIFTAVLDAANDCLARFDARPPDERWCDALLHLLDLAHSA